MPPLRIQLIRLRDDIGSLLLFVAQSWTMRKWPDINYIRTRHSSIERKLYVALCQAGYRVKAQYTFGAYRCDLALPKYKLAIECDGAAYHASKQQQALDQKKGSHIRHKHKWHLLRFSGSQINRNLAQCIAKIDKFTGRNP